MCLKSSAAPDATKTDGCCPKGATPVTDKDCKAVCGNGLLEPGETCDTAITSGPSACETACDDQYACTTDVLEGSACTAHCTHTPVAPSGANKDGCCPKGHSSETDADCLPPCDADKTTDCVDLCQGVNCPAGQYCQRGKCVVFPDGGPPAPTADGGPGPKLDKGWSQPAPSGCNCRVAERSSFDLWMLLLLAGAALLLVPRRRRRR
jgi:MYXO-CTERM domain-containing protein